MGNSINSEVLIIEDDQDFAEMLHLGFRQNGIGCHTANSVTEGLRVLVAVRPDIVITDVDLPDIDGWQAITYIRDFTDVPILVMSGRTSDSNVIQALEAGAIDFLPKPISPRVLVARTRAILSPSLFSSNVRNDYLFDDGYLTIDAFKHLVMINRTPIKISQQEFKLLIYMVQNADRILPAEEILENVWGWEYRDNIEYIHVYLSRLRRKLEQNPKEPHYFVSVYGVGYRFNPVQDEVILRNQREIV